MSTRLFEILSGVILGFVLGSIFWIIRTHTGTLAEAIFSRELQIVAIFAAVTQTILRWARDPYS